MHTALSIGCENAQFHRPLYTCITWHFAVLKRMPHASSHYFRTNRSACNASPIHDPNNGRCSSLNLHILTRLLIFAFLVIPQAVFQGTALKFGIVGALNRHIKISPGFCESQILFLAIVWRTGMEFMVKSPIITLRIQQTRELFSNICCKMVLDSVASNNVSFSENRAFYCLSVHEEYLTINVQSCPYWSNSKLGPGNVASSLEASSRCNVIMLLFFFHCFLLSTEYTISDCTIDQGSISYIHIYIVNPLP